MVTTAVGNHIYDGDRDACVKCLVVKKMSGRGKAQMD